MQLTKIIATVGPDILHEDAIQDLIRAGVGVFRFNFKHNTVEWHSDGIKLVNTVSESMGVPVATLIDLQGPSIRVNMPEESLTLAKEEKIYFGEVVFEKKLAHTWSYVGYGGMSQLTFELFAIGGKTKLVLMHAGLESFPADVADFAFHNFEEGWNQIINISLKNYLEKK